MSFTAELKRRNVVRVGIAYLLAAWVILQVSDVVLPLLDGPDWLGKTVLIALLVGFPVAIVLAWIYELTPDGVKLEKDVDRSRSISDVTGRKLDFVIIGVLMVAVTMFALDKFVWSDGDYAGELPQSIAVLPFINMTPDKEQEYFSDGLTEELLNLLVRIPELRVASRTSSFFYKGKDIRISDVGRDLGVGHVLEGSVRRSGDTVRITAQLIDVPNDTHVWSEVFERTLDDIFAIQDEIANSVVAALRVRLLGDMPQVAATSSEAYSLYLQAGEKMNSRDVAERREAQVLLQRALEIDEAYIPAWLRLADAYSGGVGVENASREHLHSLAREVALQAVRIDPDSVEAVEKLSSIGISFASEAGGDVFTRSLNLDDPLSGTRTRDSRNLLPPDFYAESIAFFQETAERDPAAAVYFVLGQHYWLARRFDEASAALRQSLQLDPERAGAHFYLAASLLAAGETDDALDVISREPDDGYRLAGLAIMYAAIDDGQRSTTELDRLLGAGYRWPYQVAQVFSYRGESDRAIEWLGHANERRDPSLVLLGGDPLMDNIRDHPGFSELLSANVENVQ